MDLSRRIYRLSPNQLSAETIAVTFAKTSRSPEPFDVIAKGLDAEKSSKFSEKWIVGYGHSSVAEHAVLHLALENVSRLAIETIEGNRLASYTEKSTRYQEWDPKAYIIPPEIINSAFQEEYVRVMDLLFATYAEALACLRPWSEAQTPQKEGETEKAWMNRARVKAVDVARYLLPASAFANVGVTINARALEYAIKKMLSSEIAEVREIGNEVKTVASQELPTLVKYTAPISYLPGVTVKVNGIATKAERKSVADWCQLLEFDPAGENKVLAAILFRFSENSYQVCLDQILNMTQTEKQNLANDLFIDLGDFDIPLRELEYTGYTFELMMDQGAFFEYKRHRMMTQSVQSLTTRLGFAIPRAITEAGFETSYRQAMHEAGRLYETLAAWNAHAASYVVPNAFNRRLICYLNLRELFHFAKLRCGENAHFAIRRVARRMLEKIAPLHPLMTDKILVCDDETSESISDQYFSALNVAVQP